ncbi:MAG: thioredoxin family protein [Acidobacteria bacterium]|nr:MAG: thioredoxin family protein [Acidobacteriota bacterium]
MAETLSTMLALGTTAPRFKLRDVVTGKEISLDTFAGKSALLVMFISRHCPYVQHVKSEIARVGKDYSDKALGIVAITDRLKEMAQELRFLFPVCYDETQDVAKAFSAACTPDFFLFDKQRKLSYRGQMDDSRPGNSIPVTGRDLRTAIDALLAGRPVPQDQRPSIGCNIKWKPGNAPQYFRQTGAS